MDNKSQDKYFYFSLIFIFVATLVWSLIHTFSMLTWVPLALPAILLLIGLVLTQKKFKFSKFVYIIVLIHCIVLLIGAKYTYERNPLFEYIKELLDWNRNHYDRVGHFFQGLTPAFMGRELYSQKGYFKSDMALSLVVLSTVMGISATYELLEFATSLISGYPPEVVLSYQGSIWDTQYDMFFALIGGILALTIFRKFHDKFMSK